MTQEQKMVHQNIYLILVAIDILLFIVTPVGIEGFIYGLRIGVSLIIAIYLRCVHDSEKEKHIWKYKSNFWISIGIYAIFNMFLEFEFVFFGLLICIFLYCVFWIYNFSCFKEKIKNQQIYLSFQSAILVAMLIKLVCFASK